MKAARLLAAAIAFGAGVATIVILLGTRDLESYEHVFFSLDRGTAVESEYVLGLPVYTLAVGLGVRLPLQGSLGASPAARLAPYLPDPLTYGLLLTFAIAAAVLLVRYALEPLCGRYMTWLAVVLLFCSLPTAAYTIYGDWPEVAVTYCASIGSVFAPHALLALLGAQASLTAPRVGRLSVAGTVFGLVAISHPGYWPIVAAALLAASMVALFRSDHPLRTRLTVVAVIAAASIAAIAPQMPDIVRELTVATDIGAMKRFVEETPANVISANVFPFGPVGPRMPFAQLILALLSLLIGLTSRNVHMRRLILGSACASIVLGIGAATLSPSSSVYAPSKTWALRDPAAALAVFSVASAATALRASRHARSATRTWSAAVALVLAALQGPA